MNDAKQLNVDGDLLQGETPAWTVVDNGGDARLYVETGEDGNIEPGDAFVEPTRDGRLIEVGLIEEREFVDYADETGVPLVDVATGEEIGFVGVEDLAMYEGVVGVELVS